MTVLKFTLTVDAVSQIHDILTCLGKFSDSVFIEARQERVGASSLLGLSRSHTTVSSFSRL